MVSSKTFTSRGPMTALLQDEVAWHLKSSRPVAAGCGRTDLELHYPLT